jgi:hypothetical protein
MRIRSWDEKGGIVLTFVGSGIGMTTQNSTTTVAEVVAVIQQAAREGRAKMPSNFNAEFRR